MPTFEFTSPDGKKYEVDAPQGATKEQAFDVLQKQISTPSKPSGGGVGQFLADSAVAGGRIAVDAASGLAGLVGNPLNASINMAGESLGFNPNLSTNLNQQATSAYDAVTNNRGKPVDGAGRIIAAAGAGLLGGGIAGGIAKAAGAAPAVVEALGINSLPSMLSEAGAGAGAQAGTELSPDNPIAGFLGAIVGAGTPMAAASTPRGVAKSLGVNPEKIAMLQKAELPVNIPAASDSDSLRYLASASQNLPLGGKLKSMIDSAYKKADDVLKNLGFTGEVTPSQGGEIVKEGLVKWRNQKKAAFNTMDGAFDTIVPKTTKLNSQTFSTFADNAVSNIVNGEGLTKAQITQRLEHPAVRQLQSLSDAAKNGEPITLNALNETRKTIGELTAKSPLVPSYDTVITNKAYDALHQVRREAARAVGGERAVKLLDDKNAFYKKYIDEEKNFNAKLVQKLGDTPEAIFNQMTSNNKVGASDAKRTMARLTGDERDAFRDALIRQKGGGDDFSIGKWAGEYKNMSDDAKNAFFMGKADLRKAHDNLMQGVEVYKDLGRFKNTSNTAVHSFANKLLTGGIGTGVGVGAGIIAGAGNVIGGVVLGGTMNKAFSELMSSPRATIALSNILKNPPATQAAFVSTLTKALKAAGMTDDEASDEIENLKQDALQPSTELPRGVISNPKQQPSVTIGNEPIDENGYYEQITPQSNTFTSPNSSFNTPTQREEGLRTSVYQDTTGNATIGYGFNLDSPSASKVWKTAKMPVNFNQAKRGEVDITAEEAQRLYDTSEQIATADARAFYPQFDELSKTQKEALVDMSYQLGLPRLKEFKGLRKALIQGNKAGIMKSLIESELHKQTPERNNRRISMLMN